MIYTPTNYHNMLMLVERVIQGLVTGECQMKGIRAFLEHFRISNLYNTEYRVNVRLLPSCPTTFLLLDKLRCKKEDRKGELMQERNHDTEVAPRLHWRNNAGRAVLFHQPPMWITMGPSVDYHPYLYTHIDSLLHMHQ